jgi:23S rRNA (cytosine1962-C5)-methyltransferase
MIVLKKGREKSLRRRHPWIFSGAVEKASGKAGDTVEVRDSTGKALALAAYSPKSQIRARAWTFDTRETVDAGFFRRKIERALAMREALPTAKQTNAMRLINAESDGLPGLVVDRYADVLVAQFLAAGVERWRDPILDALMEVSGCAAIYERSDAEVRKLEGLEVEVGFARGNRNASRCPIIEHGLNFRVDVGAGAEDRLLPRQRDNRQRVRALAAGRDVLDGFATPAVSPLPPSPAVRSASPRSNPRKRRSRSPGRISPPIRSTPRKVEFVQADVFKQLRALRDQNAKIRPGRARPAQVRAERGAGEKRRARLQGHQPLGAQAARARRAARHLLLLGRRLGGAFPVDRRGRGGRRGRGSEDHRALRRGRGSSRGDRVSGGRIPEGPAASSRVRIHAWQKRTWCR